jgi:hypothetical protein
LAGQLSLIPAALPFKLLVKPAKAEMAADYRRIGEFTALATRMKSLDP